MNGPSDIRENAARFYEKALRPSAAAECCGPSGAKRNAIAAGYDATALQGLPEDATGNSFGCGNPLAFAGVAESQTVLDPASGTGLDLIIAARKVGPNSRVIDVDRSDVMLARARGNIEQARLYNVELRKGVIEELPIESGSVDGVISNCVINLSPDKVRVFREIHRVLKSDGRMLVSDIVADGCPSG